MEKTFAKPPSVGPDVFFFIFSWHLISIYHSLYADIRPSLFCCVLTFLRSLLSVFVEVLCRGIDWRFTSWFKHRYVYFKMANRVTNISIPHWDCFSTLKIVCRSVTHPDIDPLQLSYKPFQKLCKLLFSTTFWWQETRKCYCDNDCKAEAFSLPNIFWFDH